MSAQGRKFTPATMDQMKLLFKSPYKKLDASQYSLLGG